LHFICTRLRLLTAPFISLTFIGLWNKLIVLLKQKLGHRKQIIPLSIRLKLCLRFVKKKKKINKQFHLAIGYCGGVPRRLLISVDFRGFSEVLS
jgi:hypothetical protein